MLNGMNHWGIRRRRARLRDRRRLYLESLERRDLLACLANPPIDFQVVNDWGSGFQGEISVQNNSTAEIRDWSLSFSMSHQIEQIWNGTILSQNGASYEIGHVGWNANLAPGASASFGFVAASAGQIAAPGAFVLCDGSTEPPGPLTSITVADIGVTEGDETSQFAELDLRLSAASDQPVQVSFATTDGSAVANQDYLPVAGIATFEPGATSRRIQVPIVGDLIVEPQEEFRLELSDPLNAVLAVESATITIEDNDNHPQDPNDCSDATVEFVLRDDWGAGFVADVIINNNGDSAIDGWNLEFELTANVVNIWNAVVNQHSGNRLVLGNAPYNAQIPPGGQVVLGFEGSPGNIGDGLPSEFLLNGEVAGCDGQTRLSIADLAVTEGNTGATIGQFEVTLTSTATETVTFDYDVQAATADAQDVQIKSGSLAILAGERSRIIEVAVFGDVDVEPNETFRVVVSNVVGAEVGDLEAIGTILNDDVAPPVTPSVEIGDAQADERDVTEALAPGFLSTSGNQIVDANGTPVKLTSVAWFGFESDNNAPHGLWTRNYRDMMDEIVAAGFNSLRLPINNQMFDPGSVSSGIDTSANPDLAGLSPSQVLDKIVDYAGQINLRIVLDHHRSDNGIGALNDGLWYTAEYPEERFLADWRMLAARYRGNPTVIGADLHNEPHGPATWGTGDTATDWRLAAERAGNAVLAENPDWLIIVEGIETYDNTNYWWGGNLKGVRQHPVRLDSPNKLVYSPHAYPNSIYKQPWFSDPNFPNNLPDVWRDRWGFIFEENIAPIWLGEFGSRLEEAKDIAWMEKLVGYLGGDLNGDGIVDISPGEEAISWSFWSWNPNSGDTGGILRDDWRTLNQEKLDLLAPVQFEQLPTDGGTNVTPEISYLDFPVTLSEPTSVTVRVDFATSPGTATAELDFRALTGTLEFRPGEVQKTIRVEILGDLFAEGTESLSVNLSGLEGGVFGDPSAMGTILDNDAAAAGTSGPVALPHSGALHLDTSIAGGAVAPPLVSIRPATLLGRTLGETQIHPPSLAPVRLTQPWPSTNWGGIPNPQRLEPERWRTQVFEQEEDWVGALVAELLAPSRRLP